ncbi:SCO family protein [Thiocapsa sp.]|uniref:SCO family protein n=1 Tax=Thiocapsa sp. TaxID=2024551 RepID=UPI0025D429D7|nr:SCO family protein [Thiocapsa sp.]
MQQSKTSARPLIASQFVLPLAGLLVVGFYATAPVHAHEAHHHGHGAVTATAADVTLFDLPLLRPDGAVTTLPTALADKPAAIVGFFYSECDVACPITTKLLQGVMAKLSEVERARTRVILLTLDPDTDTPEVLTEYAAQMKVPDDWTLLTGKPAEVNRVLVGLGAYASDLESHPQQLLVRAAPDAGFLRLFGLPDAGAIRGTLARR